MPAPCTVRAPPWPEMTPSLRPEAALRMRDWFPKLVDPEPVRVVMVTGLVAWSTAKLPLLMMPLELLIEPPFVTDKVEPTPMVVAPVYVFKPLRL